MQTDVSTRSNESTACGPRVWLAIEQAHDGGVVEERAGCHIGATQRVLNEIAERVGFLCRGGWGPWFYSRPMVKETSDNLDE